MSAHEPLCEGLNITAEVDRLIAAGGSECQDYGQQHLNRLAIHARIALGGCGCGAYLSRGAGLWWVCGKSDGIGIRTDLLVSDRLRDLTIEILIGKMGPWLPGVGLRGVGRPPQVRLCDDCRCPEAPGETRMMDGRMKRWNTCNGGRLMCPRCSEVEDVTVGYYRDGSGLLGWNCARCGSFPITPETGMCNSTGDNHDDHR